MLYLLDKDVRTVKWNGIPLHEASSAIVKEEINGDFVLTVHYPITNSGIYQLIKEDMLIKAPVPVLGAQLFRIKKPVENDDSLDITAYHISDDVMQRSINPLSVVGQGCAMALSQMVQNAKTDLGTFSFTSDIMDSRTFNTTDAETLYSVLLDGKHSIVGTWEGELVRDNFALTIKRSRGADRGVVITTHKNLKSYQRTKNSQSVVTRIHAKSTFKAEGAETDTVLTVTVDSPLIGNYPYINEKEYENNDAKTIDELRKWAEAKFKHEGIDKISDAIEIEAYELDGQVVHLGDTVNIKSRKHNVDIHKKAIAYEYNALTEEYISITFDDKPGVGGSGVFSGVANAADVILGVNANAQEIAVERAIRNANQAFDAEFEKRVEEINDGIEQSKAEAELYADNIKQKIDAEIDAVNQSMQAQAQEHDRQVADILTRTGANADLANVAKQLAERAQADLATIRTNLTGLIAQTNTKAGQLEQSITSVRADVASQARSILAQAQAQTALTNRVTTVETLADGTRSTVAELSKTVSKATGDIASVSSRTRTVEDTLSQTRTQYEALTQTVNTQTGQIESINRKTADLQSGIDGVTERFESLRIEDNLLLNSSFNENLNQWQRTGVTIVDGKARITGEFNKTKYIYQSIKSQIANDDVSQVYIVSISVKVTNYVAGSINPFLALYISGRKNDSVKTWFGATYLTAARLEAVNNRGVVQFTTTFKVNVPRSQIGSIEFHIYARDFTGE
ncbi:TPA: phage tail protein, partial [Streptococcus suis]|nr:phage tail protein [Streptococcus suis]